MAGWGLFAPRRSPHFPRNLWQNAVVMTNLAAAAPASDYKRPVMTRRRPGQPPRKASTIPALFPLFPEAA